jgi:hypothetical protein
VAISFLLPFYSAFTFAIFFVPLLLLSGYSFSFAFSYCLNKKKQKFNPIKMGKAAPPRL